MRNKPTNEAAAENTAGNVAEQAKPRARRTRRLSADGEGAPPRARRPRPVAKKGPDVFGVHTALFDRMQQQAALATIMKKHLEAMQAEFSTLNPGSQEVCNKLIDKIAQSGMDTLTNMNLVPKPDRLKPEKSESEKDQQLKKVIENL